MKKEREGGKSREKTKRVNEIKVLTSLSIVSTIFLSVHLYIY